MLRVRSVGQLAVRAAATWGGRTAVICGGRRLSFRGLEARVASLRSALDGVGVGPGCRVAIHLPNGMDYLAAYFAVPATGAALVPLNTFLAPPELTGILRDCAASVVIVSRASLSGLTCVLDALPDLRTVLVPGEEGPVERPPGLDSRVSLVGWSGRGRDGTGLLHADSASDERRPALIVYTSGTTGVPKGVVLSHANLLSNAAACVEAVGATSRDRILVALPLFHSFTGMVGVLAPVLSGMSIVMCGKLDRGEVRRAITWHRPTIFPAIPAVYAAMTQSRVGRLARWLNPIRVYISGGAPLPAETLRGFEGKFGRPLCEGYGLSEASPVVSLNRPAGPRKAGSVGIPLPGVSVRVVDPEGCDLAPGETGELLVGGPGVMQGYLGRDEETRRVLDGGWLRTGDLAHVDPDGFIFIMGRSKEMLIHRGMNVYPREIEEVLEAHPSVREAAVIGVPDPDRGEVPHAFVVPREGAAVLPGELRRACLARLARYKVPRDFSIVPDLPRNAAGKVLKESLRERTRAAVAQPSG